MRLWQRFCRWFWFTREPVANMAKPAAPNPAKPRRRHRQTLVQLLDSLEWHFDRLTLADFRWSETAWQTRRGLKKIGPYVPPPNFTIDSEEVVTHKERPSVLFVAPYAPAEHGDEEEDDDDPTYLATFAYAIKQERWPTGVERVRGVDGDLYEVGVAWPGAADGAKLAWTSLYALVFDNGEVRPLRVRTRYPVTLPNGAVVQAERWTYGIEHILAPEGEQSPKDWARETTCRAFNCWRAARGMWSIMVRRGNRRMTFAVQTRDTKHFFRDRVPVYIGRRRRPIVHYVAAHDRRLPNGDTVHVMAHLRGERQFTWHDFEVNVKSPELSGDAGLLTEIFDAPGIVVDDDECPRDMVGLPGLAATLLRADERPQRNIADLRRAGRGKR